MEKACFDLNIDLREMIFLAIPRQLQSLGNTACKNRMFFFGIDQFDLESKRVIYERVGINKNSSTRVGC